MPVWDLKQLAMSADGSRIVVASQKAAQFFIVGPGLEPAFTFPACTNNALVAISDDGKRVITAAGSST